MYCDFYQLTERPFNVTPDPKFLYLNARYQEALASLHYGITQRRGFITLIGEAGTGKTTLLKRILDDLDSKTKTVLIFNPNVSFEEILEYILAEFDLPVHNGKKLYMLQRLNTFLLEELRGSGNVALLIDEAQDLEFSVLEDLRLLSNLETAKEKILQIVLSGQPELGQKLSNPALRQLRQRIGINCRLLPLSRDEISEYIQCRLQAAQCPDPKLFTRDAEDQIFHFSRGIPRLVNVVCDNALVIGYAVGKKRIGADIISEAAADLLTFDPQVEDASSRPPGASVPNPSAAASRPWRRWATAAGGAVLTAAALAGFFVAGRSTRPPVEEPRPAARVEPLEVIRPGSVPGGAGVSYPREPGRDAALGVDRGSGSDPAAKRDAEYAEAAATGRADNAEEPAGGDEDEIGAAVPIEDEPVRGAQAPDRPRGSAEDVAVKEMPAPQPAAARHERTDKGLNSQPAAEALPADAPEPVHAPAVQGLGREEVAALPRRVEPRPGPQSMPAKPPVSRPELPAAPPVPAVQPAAESRPAAVAAVPLRLPPRQPAAATADQVAPATNAAGEVKPAAAPPEAVGAGDGTAAEPSRAPAADESDAEEVPAAPRADAQQIGGVEFAEQTVRVGDSMSAIAERKYGQVSYTILDIMKLANPELSDIDAISVGQKLRLPELSDGVPVLKGGGGRYSFLVLSTPRADRAKAVQAALRQHGLNAAVTVGTVGAGKPLHRVVLSGYKDQAQVVEVGKQVQQLFREDARLAALGE